MIYLAFVSCGALAGLLAGLLGIGGGLVTVPFLLAMAPALHIQTDVVPQTVAATSLAAMVPTTFAAAWAQYRSGAVDIEWARRFVPGVSTGIICTTALFGRVTAPPLMFAFVGYALWCGTRMLLPLPTAMAMASDSARAGVAPRRPATSVHSVSAILGAASAAVGLGGAFISVPYLLRQGLPMRRALATASAISLLVCTVGCLSYALFSRPGSHEVRWLLALTVGLVATATAPLGVALSRRLPVELLRQMFGVLAIVGGLSVLRSL